MKNIAFIGVGVMGKSMVRNLNKAGYHITIFTRTKSKVNDLINEGIDWCNSIQECVQNKDIIMTMVGYPKDVEDIYYGNHGILENAKENATYENDKSNCDCWNNCRCCRSYSLRSPNWS